LGHDFCRAHYRIKHEQEDSWLQPHTQSCYSEVRVNYNAVAIRVKYIPTFKGTPGTRGSIYPCQLTPAKAERFISDVLEICPGVATRVDEYVFEFPLGTWPNYWKFLGVASLLRYIEEWWMWVDHYFEMVDSGIPKDVAAICMGLYDKDSVVLYCGHAFNGTLSDLASLKDFNLKDVFLKSCETATSHSTIWHLLNQRPWFTVGEYNFADWFKMTPQIYKIFVNDSSIKEKQQALGMLHVYKALL